MATDTEKNEPEMTPRRSDRRWDTSTKRTVALVFLLFLVLVVYQFRLLLRPLVTAFLLAFILNPVIDLLENDVDDELRHLLTVLRR